MDVDTIVSALKLEFEVLREIEDPFDQEQVEAASATLDDEGVQSDEEGPSDELEAFILAECGIDMSGGSE